jgi:hypothetical protein
MKLKIKVYDQNNTVLFCKIIIKKLSCYTTQYAEGSIQTVYCDGFYECSIENGFYDISVYRGKLYKPFRQRIHVNGNDIYVEAVLHNLLDVESMGLYAFDGHSHVSRDGMLESGHLLSAAAIMKGEGFHYFFAGSPYNHETHLEYLNNSYPDTSSYRTRFSSVLKQACSDDFFMDIGNEIVKCRYGHVFLMNYTQYPPFSKYYDHEYDPWQYTKEGEEPPYKISYIHEALANEKDDCSVAVSAHPTSWWHDNGEFITNIAATLGFEILAESIDAMVVMGYDSDHAYYQQLWFDALNNGYFLPGVAETDTAFDTISVKHITFKTYTYVDEGSGKVDALCDAIKNGRNIVSSGPLITLKVNNKLPGSVLGYSENEQFHIVMEAFACFEGQLSKVQLLINGEVYKEYNILQNYFKSEEYASFDSDSYIIAKCYDSAGNVSFTNPVYIRNNPFVNRGFSFVNRGFLSDVKVSVFQNGTPATGVYSVDDGPEYPFENEIHLKMKVSARLSIRAGGKTKTIRLFELEELQDIFKNLYLGHFNRDKKYSPGEVPADCFQLKRIREILKSVNLTINF